MRFINHNKVYWVFNRDLGINFSGGHYVIITWFNRRKNLCRVKTITSLEHKNTRNNQYYYSLVFLKSSVLWYVVSYFAV